MTVIITIQDPEKDVVYLGADRMISNTVTKSVSSCPKFFKKQFNTYTAETVLNDDGSEDIVKSDVVEHYLIFAGAGSDSVNSYIQYAFRFPDKIESDTFETYLLLDLLPSIREELDAVGLMKTGDGGCNDTEANFLIIYDGQVYPVFRDLGYSPSSEEYNVIGVGSEIAYGSLYSTKELSPMERIRVAIGACSYHCLFVDDNMDIIQITSDDYLVE